VGALRRDRLLRPHSPPLRLPPHRRPGRPLYRRAAHRRPPRRPGPDSVPADTAQLDAYFEKIRPELAATPEAYEVAAFLQSPPVPRLLLPARAAVWRRAAGLAYAALPPFAHELYGRPAPAAGRPAPAAPVVTRRLRTTGRVLRAIPSYVRWQLPPGRILKAVGRLGPGTQPSQYRLKTEACHPT
jgi:hypothetical protein